jgi:hypothetical protein
MNVLQPEEESILLGKPYAAFIVFAPITVGQVFSFTVGATTISYTATVGDSAAPDPLDSVASGLLTQIQANLPGYLSQRALLTASNAGPGRVVSSAIQFSVLPASGATTFTLTGVSGVTVVATGGQLPSPQFIVDDGNGVPANATVAYGLLPICDALEQQLISSSQNMGFSKVGSDSLGGATFRPDELRIRDNLLQRYRHEMGVMLAFYEPNSATGIRGAGIQV